MRYNKLLFMLVLLIINTVIFPKNLIVTKKAAKVGDEIILQEEVENVMNKYNLDEKTALDILIDNTLLLVGAKMYMPEPIDEAVDEIIKRQKIYYASVNGIDLKNVADEEFLAYLHHNNLSLTSYKTLLKKKLWIENLLEKRINDEKIKQYNPTDEEINNYIKSNPEIFEERESVLLSMIYFSFFKEDQSELSIEEKERARRKAEVCYNELIEGQKFVDMVEKYSDDLITKNAQIKGRVGYINLDDPKYNNSFSTEIVDSFKIAGVGLVNKIFETKNGYYIFKIDEKLQPQKISKEASFIKARDILKRENEEKMSETVKNVLIKELREKVIIIIY
ncbi:MAG: peptidylprolyl isomerase [Spirochaetes bacterium]|nr:peptidylprolyl isomerase [Spirochaetota bacterium]